jgi:DNA polymerase V
MKAPLFALVDCNNFFVSCELIFRPDLAGRPVVVLSSGDGCAIARSNEAKALGIPMGAPVYKYRQLFKQHDVVAFSANFELYGDISRRITEILTTITPRLEVYSIDESFLDISQLPIDDYEAWGKNVRQTILKWVGVPVRVGIAPSKTLAKLASDYSKKYPELEGVSYLNPATKNYEKALRETSVEELWGVGRRQAPKLRARAVATALDLSRLAETQARSYFGSVQGGRLQAELTGLSCFPLEAVGKEQKMISATRTFGEDTSEPHVIEAALASFVTRATTRLRQQDLLAGKIGIFLTTNRHKPGYRRIYKEIKLKHPTSDTGYLTHLAVWLFSTAHQKGTQYHRGGASLSNLSSAKAFQVDLLDPASLTGFNKAQRRMRSIDAIRQKHGHKGLHYAAEDLALSWVPKRNSKSPRYTTSWSELPRAKIKHPI